ncbi:hypothetical protein EMIHUDRAFT_199063 [Emiliania huxleyi CCMP1516]|uniref:Uncharacterized protein n=2 Tax=Emiliania huxleyi TaxID=2903 RepID=A0A0D3I291_EMIH1|nr:hypothetical protein EMIHUDRAFT_199063 [Emiliania huxleyi CCMP1516]EOD05376.1 hypothetical protein EMIHUDRAFT_199063 [Emiliania huxleyi CCMP1516]|eukprot:XP_005757805.1 hypothetical protein EMIHUDRAFT_199063 [Emiliania huxleyi CCMP1516]
MSASTEQIPVATFIDDIDKYMVKEGSAEAALEKLQAFYSACKAIEQRMSQRKKRLQAKVPDIESTYNALLQMQQRPGLNPPGNT